MYEKKMKITNKAEQQPQQQQKPTNGWHDPGDHSKAAELNFGGVDGPAETDGMVLAHSKK